MNQNEIFEELYRVLAVESQSLTVQGIHSGKVLTIKNHDVENPVTATNYPPGTLIRLSDPSLSKLGES